VKYVGMIAVVAVLVALTGCASLAGTFGLASQQYVDERIEAARVEMTDGIEANKMRIDENQATLDEYARTADQLEELMESIRVSVETTEELKALADVLEDRLENLPVETIKQLVGILEQYLEGK
jgi:uncharacterized protein (DUF885 family)